MIQESSPTISASLRQSNASRESAGVFDQLGSLAEEMKTGILNLSTDHRDHLIADMEKIKSSTVNAKYPELSLVVGLYRKYSDIAHQVKDDCKEQLNKLGVIAELPSLFQAEEEKELVGWAAVRTNAFWVRAAAAILSFISFVIMATVDYIAYTEFNPSWEFQADCPVFGGKYYSGYFDFWPYQLLLALGVLLYFYSTVVAAYYLLPIDEDRNKTIPGLAGCLANCFSSGSEQQRTAHWVKGALGTASRILQVCVDGGFLVIALGAAINASVYIESAAPFGMKNYPVPVYFTLNSFYATYTRTVRLLMLFISYFV